MDSTCDKCRGTGRPHARIVCIAITTPPITVAAGGVLRDVVRGAMTMMSEDVETIARLHLASCEYVGSTCAKCRGTGRPHARIVCIAVTTPHTFHRHRGWCLRAVLRGVCGQDVERRARALACDVFIVYACMWTGRAGLETLVADFDFSRCTIVHPGTEGVNGPRCRERARWALVYTAGAPLYVSV